MGLFNFCSPDSLGHILALLIQLLAMAVFVRAILSWFVRDPYNPIKQALDTITEPILQPLRQVMPRVGMMDFSPLVALIVLSIIASVLCNANI